MLSIFFTLLFCCFFIYHKQFDIYTVNIAGVTLNQTPIDWYNNKKNILEAIEIAKKQRVDLLCLPELCITGYGCEDIFLSDWIYTKAQEILLEIIPFTANITVVIGLPIIRCGVKHNTACVVQNTEIIGFHAKQFLANDGIHYEKRWFSAWPKGKQRFYTINGNRVPFGEYVYQINGQKIGIEICEDAWHEDRPARRYNFRGVDIILNPSASHFALGKTLVRQNIVEKSSEKFTCTYVYANLLGNEAGRVIYDGEILIAKQGKVVGRNTLLSCKDINIVTTDNLSVSPYLTQNQEFRDVATLGLFDYLRKSKTKSFVLSLSGGADSSTCASLVYLMLKRAIKELGFEHLCTKIGLEVESETQLYKEILYTAYQSTVNSSEETFGAAKELADYIGATFYNWGIDEEVFSYTKKIEKAIGRPLTWDSDDITLQNIQARSRSPIIWMLANINSGLLLTTSNRSEGDVGYTTMDGDTSGSIAPIAGVDKSFRRKLLIWAEKEDGIEGLSYVNALEPTAELRPHGQHQSDEKDLMPYHIMKEIEVLAIGKYQSPVDIYQVLFKKDLCDSDLLKEYVKKFFRLWSYNQWKRERLAPSFHIDDFNIDSRTWYRFPILSGSYRSELELLDKLF